MAGQMKLDELVAEMRAGLEGATKGEWSVDGYNTSAVIFRQHGKTNVTDWMHLARCDEENANWKADAAHIARCSPENIAALLDALSGQQSLIEALTAIRDYPKEGSPRRDEDGYPLEIEYDEFAYRRIVDSYREIARAALSGSKMEAGR